MKEFSKEFIEQLLIRLDCQPEVVEEMGYMFLVLNTYEDYIRLSALVIRYLLDKDTHNEEPNSEHPTPRPIST